MKISILFFSVLSLVCFNSVFASSLDELIQDLQYQAKVNNISASEASTMVMKKMSSGEVTFSDLEDYLIDNNQEDLLVEIYANKAQFGKQLTTEGKTYTSVLMKNFLMEQLGEEKGANYSGCGGVIGLGATALVGGIVMALLALEENGWFDSCSGVCVGTVDSEKVRNLSIGAGVAGVLGFTLVASGSAGC